MVDYQLEHRRTHAGIASVESKYACKAITDRYLLIDDIRDIVADRVARTAREGMDALKCCEYTHLMLDNDLGVVGGMEGRDILKWALDNNCVPANILLVTSNVVAKKAMEDMLRYDLGYNYHRGWWTCRR